MVDAEKVEKLVDYFQNTPGFNKEITYEYRSLPICIIDCVFSLRAKYESTTLPVVRRYAKCYLGNDLDSSADSITKFIEHIEAEGGPEKFADKLKNHQVSGGVSKTEVCLRLAKRFRLLGIETIEDFREFASKDEPESLELLETVILSVKGIGNAALNYLFMLAGDQNRCKPDVHVHQFIRDACGKDVEDKEVQELFKATVEELNAQFNMSLTVAKFDGIIWNKYQVGRKDKD